MAASLNRATIIGNLGKDPEVRNTQSGGKIVNLTIAASERWKDKASGEYKERTEWLKVVVFNPNLAEIAEKYLRKGSRVFVEGSIQTRKWTDQSGQDKYSTEVVLQQFGGNLILLDGKARDEGSSAGRAGGYPPEGGSEQRRPERTPDDLDEQIPF